MTFSGIDWQRAKWSGFASKYIKFGEKVAVRFADEIIVLSEGVQKYFKDTYGRETVFIPNGVNRPEIREAKLIKEKFGLDKDSYILFLGRIVPEKGVSYLIEAFKQIDTDIVPLYSYHINTSDMGYYDLVITIMSMVQPIFTLQMTDGVYRWLLGANNDKEKKTIISTTLKTIIAVFVVVTGIYLILNISFDFRYSSLIWILIVTHTFYALLQQIARGLGQNKIYSYCGVFYTIIMLLINIYGLLIVDAGVEILLLSQTIANIICSTIIFLRIPIIRMSISECASREKIIGE